MNDRSYRGGGGHDALCFTSGVKGAYFGAGVIHAYLAARRNPPRVAAGISIGALSSAAMQKCFAELKKTPAGIDDDSRYRWAWFRRYIRALTDNPLSVLWEAIPDQSDFFADMPPIRDISLRQYENGEREARRQRYVLIKIARWCADLPIRVRTVAEAIVDYVRFREGYGHFALFRLIVRAAYLVPLITFSMLLPTRKNLFADWYFEREPGPDQSHRRQWKRYFNTRPLFGWKIYGLAAVIAAFVIWALSLCVRAAINGALEIRTSSQMWSWAIIAGALLAAFIAASRVYPIEGDLSVEQNTRRALIVVVAWMVATFALRHLFLWSKDHLDFLIARITALFLVFLVITELVRWRRTTSDNKFLEYLSAGARLRDKVISDFYLSLRLKQLFDPSASGIGERGNRKGQLKAEIELTPMAVVLVAAPLQGIERRKNQDDPPYAVPAQQLWARPGTPILAALRAALSLPGLTPPEVFEGEELAWWGLGGKTKLAAGCNRIHLVDGSVIRHNPIPALFDFLELYPKIAKDLEGDTPEDRRLHVIFNVPLDPQSDAVAPSDIIDVGLLSLKLAQRRDTKVEVDQTEFISTLEYIRRSGQPPGPDTGREFHAIFPDTIAPESDLDIGAEVNPDRGKCLATIASACRRTLAQLYSKQLPEDGEMGCQTLLDKVWSADNTKNQNKIDVPVQEVGGGNCSDAHKSRVPGLSEVCSQCNGKLRSPKRISRSDLLFTHKEFPRLAEDKPRIVFVASGGVFRGPFQIGVLAAMLQAQVRVDLVVGASVGTLVGSVFAACRRSEDQTGVKDFDRILQIAETFVNADERIALTSTFKNALRELGIRGRAVKLSPREIKRAVMRGSRFDAGFAAIGAPPALLDALSTLLVLPFERTKKVAQLFVAGRITDAVRVLIKSMRRETLERLGINNYLIGVSLLEQEAIRLLSLEDRGDPQPFLPATAVFGMTTNLNTRDSRILGDPLEYSGSFDFIEAALSSSAFPAVFQPRKEGSVFPGYGRDDVVFSDGGMFDNLPFLPAIRILGRIQATKGQADSNHAGDQARFEGAMQRLQDRHAHPDLIIAGSLDANPQWDDIGPFDSIFKVSKRAKLLSANVKIRDFQLAALRVHGQIDTFANKMNWNSGLDHTFVDSIVDAAVLPIFPTDRNHLNPTFAFCRSLNLEADRVLLSVADGCYNTLKALANASVERPLRPATNEEDLSAKSVKKLLSEGKLQPVQMKETATLGQKASDGKCPFFQLEEQDFQCPFHSYSGPAHLVKIAKTTYVSCCQDSMH